MITLKPESTEKRLADLDEVLARHAPGVDGTVSVWMIAHRPKGHADEWITDYRSTSSAARSLARVRIAAGDDVILGRGPLTGLVRL